MSITTHLHGFLPHQTSSHLFGLDPRNTASCGIFSLHHAMIFLGYGGDYSEVRDSERSVWKKLMFGMELDELVRLTKRCKFHPTGLKTRSIREARAFVNVSLKEGRPVIVGSEPQVHWICVGGRTADGGYVKADSASSPAVGTFESWDALEEWMTVDEDSGEPSELEYGFELIRVSPGENMQAGRSMVHAAGDVWEGLAEDEDYAFQWSNMTNDMVDVFWDKALAPRGIGAAKFFDSHMQAIAESVAEMTDHPLDDLLEIMDGYRKIAHVHNLVVPSTEISRATAKLAYKVGEWADEMC